MMATEIARRGEHRLPLSSRSPQWLFAVGLHGLRWGNVAWARGGSRVWVAGWLSLSLDQSLPQPSFFFSRFARSAKLGVAGGFVRWLSVVVGVLVDSGLDGCL